MRRLLLAGLVLLAVATGALLSIPLLLVDGAQGACVQSDSSSQLLDQGQPVKVGASSFGGPGDPGTGSTGYREDDLTGKSAYAELSSNSEASSGWDFAALGDLPYRTRLRISVTVGGRSRSIVAEKLDVGRGGPPIQGRERRIDLWWEAVEALGLDGTSGTWSGVVTIQRTRAPVSTGAAGAECDPAATTPAGPLGRRIVQIARGELAKGISEPGNNCVTYNNCDGNPWCASFVSYVWARAGVPMPYTAASNVIWIWASQHAKVLGPSERPQPGDAVLYGTGPESVDTSKHVGLVENVYPDGRITVIEGNLSDAVKRNGPFHPRDAASSGEPAAIYAYARPAAVED